MIEQLPANVIGIKARGVITSQDYVDELIPTIKKKLETHEHINLLYVAGDDFRAYSAGAVWDDTRLGMMHIADFQKIALVTDISWMRKGAKVFGPLLKGRMHVFAMSELEDAKSWVKR